jgi:glycosyltransferase involved in cell wall biosynthesis
MRYDVIHLTDGDPFAFLVLFLSFFLKDYIWVIHLIFDPGSALGKIDYSSLWFPIYRRSLNRNCFVFLCENEKIKKAYEGVINGLFNRKTIYFPLSTRYVGNTYTKEEARLRLKLPVGKILFLCFGSQHSGKDLMVVASACRDLANVEIVIAGKGSADTIYHLKLANNTIIIRDYYVPEHEKPLYYAAADAVIISYHKSFLERRSGALLWDACKFGAMVIASDGGQIGELVKSFQVGLVFETENPVSLRNAIVHFFNLRQEDINIYKENCKEFCASFSMESWSENYKVMLDNLFTNRHT